MRSPASVLAILGSIALLVPICGFAPDPAEVPAVPILVTAAPVYEPLAELRGRERFPQGAQLLIVRDGKAEPLVSDFAATADANVSFDGESVLFAGKKTSGDRWQIWEMTLKNHSVRKVITTPTDAERPLYLPGWRMVYALRTPSGFQLQSVEDGHPPAYIPLNPTTGPGPLSLSYTQANAFPADVLRDGRILFEAGFPLAWDRRRSCISSTPTARASSRTAAITAWRAGAASSWPRAMWCLRTVLRWRGSLRLWRTRSGSQRRVVSTQERLWRLRWASGW